MSDPRAWGRVLDARGAGVRGEAYLYAVELEEDRDWYAILDADGVPKTSTLFGRVAFWTGRKVGLVGDSHPLGAGGFDVPDGLPPGTYYLDVHAADGRQAWAWPLVVTDGAAAQEVVLGGPVPDVPEISVGDFPAITPLAKQFTRGTFTAALSLYGLLGAPFDRIKRDFTRARAAGFGHGRVWVDWEGRNGVLGPDACRLTRRADGSLVPAKADLLDEVLALCEALGFSLDLTFETAHYDAVKVSGEGYKITAHKNAVRNVLTRWGQHPSLKIVDVDNEAEVRGAGNHGSPDTGHTSPGRFAELMAVARSVPHTCLVSCSASEDGAPYRSSYTNGYLFRDTKGDVLLPHFKRVAGWGAQDGPKGAALSREVGLPWYSQEPARNGWQGQTWPVSEFEALFRSTRANGALGACFHTGAWFDVTSRDGWDQLDAVERQVVDSVNGWTR